MKCIVLMPWSSRTAKRGLADGMFQIVLELGSENLFGDRVCACGQPCLPQRRLVPRRPHKLWKRQRLLGTVCSDHVEKIARIPAAPLGKHAIEGPTERCNFLVRGQTFDYQETVSTKREQLIFAYARA